MKTRTFFRWMPTAIVLWIFAVVSALATVSCVWFATQATKGSIQLAMIGDSRHLTRWFLRGAIENAMIGVFCFMGWYLMRRRISGALVLGAIAVMGAVFIICFRSICWIIRGGGFEYWGDAVLELPFLVYSIIYAYRESKKQPNTAHFGFILNFHAVTAAAFSCQPNILPRLMSSTICGGTSFSQVASPDCIFESTNGGKSER